MYVGTHALSEGTLTWGPPLRWGLEDLKSLAAQVTKARGKSELRCHVPLFAVCQRWAPTCTTSLRLTSGHIRGRWWV